MGLTRRRLLAAGGGVAAAGVVGTLVEYDRLPGRTDVHALLGLNGEAGVVPDVETGPVVDGVLPSVLVASDPGYRLCYPPGTRPGDPMPVIVLLHGAGRTAARWCDELAVGRFLAAGGHRMALAAVDGGTSSFWHERSDGDDPGRMLTEEFLPFLAGEGLAADRPGLLGWSMGGLGVLMHGARLAADGTPPPVLAVSPALWPEYDQALPEAFDSAAQYDACQELAYAGLALEGARVDCGTGDPFYRDVRAVIDDAGVEDSLEQHYEPGAHEAAYWTRVLPGQLDWLAARVSAG